MRTRVFPGSTLTILCSHQLSSTFWKVSEKSNGGIKVKGQKVSFLAISGHLGAFLILFEPLGTQSVFFKNLKILFLQYNEIIPSCKISENSNEWFFLKAPDGRTGVNLQVPFPPLSGDQKRQVLAKLGENLAV